MQFDAYASRAVCRGEECEWCALARIMRGSDSTAIQIARPAPCCVKLRRITMSVSPVSGTTQGLTDKYKIMKRAASRAASEKFFLSGIQAGNIVSVSIRAMPIASTHASLR